MNYQALGFSMAACAIAIGVAFVSHKAGAYPCTYTSYGCVSELEHYNQQEELERLRYENQRLRNQRNWEGDY